jgi:sRNA-binding regulator protein Hfq
LDGVFGPEGIRVVEIFAQDGVQGKGTYDEFDTITIILNEPTVMDFGVYI